jgi:hypothetical protein
MRFQISQSQKRIGRRFQPDHLRVRLDRLFCVGDIGRIHERKLNPVALEHFVEDAICAAVHIFAYDDVITLRQQIHNGVRRAQTGAEAQTVRAALQRRQAGFQRTARRVLRARVLVAFVPSSSCTYVDV